MNFVSEVKEELTGHIIPFWESLKDSEYGGFYGYKGYDLVLDKKSEKGAILNSRILYFFSEAYKVLKDNSLLSYARHAYDFLNDHFIDRTNGGIYWSLNYDGTPKDTTKHTYNQAFAIYGLTAYYDVTHDKTALNTAYGLFSLIEGKMRDNDGYLEAYNVDFSPASNEKLSENGVMADRTMNTILHVLESYTELYRVTGDVAVRSSLMEMLRIFKDRIYNSDRKEQYVFFDKDYHSLIDLWSCGHDIETAWLIDRCLDVIEQKGIKDDSETALFSAVRQICMNLTANVYDNAFDGSSLPAEVENGVVKENRVWWIQAETVNGFLNEYYRHPSETKYLEAAESCWNYIEKYVIDKREGSEWYWEVHKDGEPYEEPIVEPWKCPYHNGRMCFNVINWSGKA